MEQRTIKVIVFSGEQDDWTAWKLQWRARSIASGYWNICNGKQPVPDDKKDEDDLDTKEEKARMANQKGFADLILSMDSQTEAGKVMLTLIASAETDALPEGCLKTAWNLLLDEFEPKSGVNRLAKRNEFDTCQLKDWKQNPVQYITRLERIRNEYVQAGGKMNAEDVLEKALGTLPEDYNKIVLDLQKRIGKGLTIKELKEDVKAAYELNCKQRGVDQKAYTQAKDANDEAAFFVGGFKGRCHHCGGYGHKRENCPELKKDGNNQGNRDNRNQGSWNQGNSNRGNWNDDNQGNWNGGQKRINGRCFYCGMWGHKESDCFKKKRDEENKRNEKGHNEAARFAASEYENDIAFVAMGHGLELVSELGLESGMKNREGNIDSERNMDDELHDSKEKRWGTVIDISASADESNTTIEIVLTDDDERPNVSKQEGRIAHGLFGNIDLNETIDKEILFGDGTSDLFRAIGNQNGTIERVNNTKKLWDTEKVTDTIERMKSTTDHQDCKRENIMESTTDHQDAERKNHKQTIFDYKSRNGKGGLWHEVMDNCSRWDYPDPKFKTRWRGDIQSEFKRMNERNVWKQRKRDER